MSNTSIPVLPPFDAQLTVPVNDYGTYDITVTEPTASMYGLDWNAFEAAITAYRRWYFGFKFASIEISETSIVSPLTFDLTDIRVQFRYDFSQRGRLEYVTTTIRGDATYLEPIFPEPATLGLSILGVILWLISSRRRGRVACR